MKYFSLLYFVHAVRGWINQTSEDRENNASSWCPLYYLQRLKKEPLQQLLQVDPSKHHVPEPQHGILPQAQVKRVSGQNDDPLQQE
jgi:hypothetical protein